MPKKKEIPERVAISWNQHDSMQLLLFLQYFKSTLGPNVFRIVSENYVCSRNEESQ